MKRLLTLVFLGLTCCGQEGNDFDQHIVLFNKINSELMSNDPSPGPKDLRAITANLDQENKDLLLNELMLNQVFVYENGGITYRFGTREKYDFEYYMIYIDNQEEKGKFLSYEQFADFQTDKMSIDDKWTFVKRKEFAD